MHKTRVPKVGPLCYKRQRLQGQKGKSPFLCFNITRWGNFFIALLYRTDLSPGSAASANALYLVFPDSYNDDLLSYLLFMHLLSARSSTPKKLQQSLQPVVERKMICERRE